MPITIILTVSLYKSTHTFEELQDVIKFLSFKFKDFKSSDYQITFLQNILKESDDNHIYVQMNPLSHATDDREYPVIASTSDLLSSKIRALLDDV